MRSCAHARRNSDEYAGCDRGNRRHGNESRRRTTDAMLRTTRLARRAVAVPAVCMRSAFTVTTTHVLHGGQAERAHALKDQGERKQQLERDAFHIGLLYTQQTGASRYCFRVLKNPTISLHDCWAVRLMPRRNRQCRKKQNKRGLACSLGFQAIGSTVRRRQTSLTGRDRRLCAMNSLIATSGFGRFLPVIIPGTCDQSGRYRSAAKST